MDRTGVEHDPEVLAGQIEAGGRALAALLRAADRTLAVPGPRVTHLELLDATRSASGIVVEVDRPEAA